MLELTFFASLPPIPKNILSIIAIEPPLAIDLFLALLYASSSSSIALIPAWSNCKSSLLSISSLINSAKDSPVSSAPPAAAKANFNVPGFKAPTIAPGAAPTPPNPAPAPAPAAAPVPITAPAAIAEDGFII